MTKKITNEDQLLTAFALIVCVCALIGGYILKDTICRLLVFEGICLSVVLTIIFIYCVIAHRILIHGQLFKAVLSEGSWDGCHFVAQETCCKDWCETGKYIHIPM